MGTPAFAVPSLDALAAVHTVITAFTRPDAPSGRGSRLVPPPVKSRALELGIPVAQPASLREADVVEQLRRLEPDVICVAAYGMLLPPDVLEIPRLGCINVHASLLPRYRGAAPIERAILNGDEVTGVSIMRMEEGLDTGPYARQVAVPVGELDSVGLSEQLARVGAEALLVVLADLESGSVMWTPQDDAAATFAAKILRQDVALAPSLAAVAALRRIRASSERVTARVAVDGVDMVLLGASLSNVPLPAGAASCTKAGLLLGFADGSLLIEKTRPVGKGAMTGSAWVCGYRGDADATWCPA
jgi:methionyl-tRNA formyltransferase